VLPPDVKQCFAPAAPGAELVYVPHVIVAGKARYSLARQHIDEQRDFMMVFPPGGATSVDWEAVRDLGVALADLHDEPAAGAAYAPCPGELASARTIKSIETQFRRWFASARPLTIYRSLALDEFSRVGEDERQFRIRLQQLGNEARDRKVAALRKRYETQVARLQERVSRAEHTVAREAEQARGHKLDTAISFGTAILGAVLGRKVISATSASRVGTAVRKAGRLGQQSGDVKRAEAVVADVQAKIAELEEEFADQVAALDDVYDAQRDELAKTVISAKSAAIEIRLIGIGWVPA
jgi:phage host-nuclease inhibitor protein Gam